MSEPASQTVEDLRAVAVHGAACPRVLRPALEPSEQVCRVRMDVCAVRRVHFDKSSGQVRQPMPASVP